MRRGFSLVEVAVAIGILSFALVGILGLLPVGLRTAQQGFDQAQALAIKQAAAMAVRNVRSVNGAYYFGDWLSGGDSVGDFQPGRVFQVAEDGTLRESDTPVATDRHRLEVTVTNAQPDLVKARIRVSWPPAATSPVGVVETVVYANLPPN